MGLKHAKTSAKSDGGDSSLVQPSDWNADHVGSPFGGWFDCKDYNGGTKNATTIQAAIDACVAAGGGIVWVGAGTWSLAGTSLTIGGDSVTLWGAGREVTILDYTGSGAAIKNSAAGTTRYNFGMRDLQINVTNSSAGAVGFECENFMRGNFDNLHFKAQGVARTCLKMIGSLTNATYYNSFRNCLFTSSGICIHMTGTGGVNRNVFWNCQCQGSGGQALVSDPSSFNTDTNLFFFLNAEGMSGNPCIDLGGAGHSTMFRFFGLTMENCTNGAVVRSGSRYNYFFAPALSGSPLTFEDALNVIYGAEGDTYYTSAYVTGHLDPTALNLPIKAGIPSDSDDYGSAQSGDIIVDTTNNRIYVRVGSTWKYAALT